MENAIPVQVKGAVEAILFISENPVTLEQLKEVLEEHEAGTIKRSIQELQDEYETQRRGMVLIEIAGGFQMLSNPYFAEYIRTFFKTRVKEKLSRPALETLAIIAYKQPVSRADIELIRGVNSDGVVTHLLNKSLIKIGGRKDIPGRPFIYGTTKLFLEYFGLKSLGDLPKLEDLSSLHLHDESAKIIPLAEGEEVPGEDSVEQTAGETVVLASAEGSTAGPVPLQETEGQGEAAVSEDETPADAEAVPGAGDAGESWQEEDPAQLKEAFEHIGQEETETPPAQLAGQTDLNQPLSECPAEDPHGS